VEAFHGPEQLEAFLGRAQILVNFLPLTAQTEGLLHAGTLAKLPRGACLVNLARGGHIIEADLLAALDSGQIGGALLDVFAREPLPPDHPFWRQPRVIVTPHIGGQAIAELMVSQVVENVRRIERGQAPLGIVDPTRGY
jgi:glyoxylate/hydroxypyruvate reductase A